MQKSESNNQDTDKSHNKLLDRIAWLLECSSNCTAISVINAQLYVASNEFFKKTELNNNQQFSIMKDILEYFQKISNGSPINEEHRNALIKSICAKQIATLTYGKVAFTENLLSSITSKNLESMLKSKTIPELSMKRADLTLMALGLACMIYRRIIKVEKAVLNARDNDFKLMSLEQLIAFQNFTEHCIYLNEEAKGVHAEMQLLGVIVKFAKRDKLKKEIYVGISKKCCRNCNIMFHVANEVSEIEGYDFKAIYAGAHNKSFEWGIPEMFKSGVSGTFGKKTRNQSLNTDLSKLRLEDKIGYEYKKRVVHP